MAAPDSDLERFDAVASRMPDLARAVEAFADEKLRERAYYELVGILNPDTEDGDTLSGDVVRRLADATREESQDGEEFGEVMLRLLGELRMRREWEVAAIAENIAEEVRDGESFAEAARRLLDELRAHRTLAAKRVAQEHWTAPPSAVELADAYGAARQIREDRQAREQAEGAD